MSNESHLSTNLSKSLSYKLLAGIADKADEEVKAHMKALAVDNTVLCQVVGAVSGYTIKNGQYGENIAFSGDFLVKSAITGEIFESTKMFFDKAFADILRGKFDQRKDADAEVKFSAQITVVKYTKSPFFTYMVTPLRTPEAITKRAEMLGTLASVPLLEKPKKKSA